MGILDTLRNFTFGPRQKRAQSIVKGSTPNDGHGLVYNLITGRDPPRRGTAEFVEATRNLPWLNLVTRARADALASVEWEHWCSMAGTIARRLPGMRADAEKRHRAVKQLADDGRLTRQEVSPILDLLDKPNRAMTGKAFMRLTSRYWDLVGEVFWLLDRDETGRIVAIWPIPPTWVKKTPDHRDEYYEVQSGAWRLRARETDIVWMRDHDVANPYARGAGNALSLQDELETDEYAARMAKGLFYNHATPTTLVILQNAKSQSELDRVKADWMDKHHGPDEAGQPHFVTGGTDVKILGQTMTDAQYVELRRFMRDMCIQTFRCPPEALGIIENSNRATIQAAAYFMAKFSTEPMAENVCAALNQWIVKEWGEHHQLFYADVVPADVERIDGLIKQFSYLFTADELRARCDAEPLPSGGNVHVVTSGLGAIPSLDQLAAPSPTQLPAGAGGTDAANGLLAQLFGGMSSPMPQDPPWALNAIDGILGEAQQQGTALLAPAPVARLRAARPLTPADIDAILLAATPDDMWEPLQPVMDDLLRTWAVRAFDDAHGKGAFDVDDRWVQQYLDDKLRGEVTRFINSTTRDALRAALVDALHDNASLDDAARRVFVDADAKRTELIAEHLVVRGTEQAKMEGWRAAGIARREWIATPDGRTREEHWDLDGEQVPLGQPFVVRLGQWAGASTMEPGGFGVAALDMRCRCVTAPVFDTRMAPEDRRVYWRRAEREREAWYGRLERAVSRGFGAQRRAVLSALEAVQ